MLITREYRCPTESEDLQLREEKTGNELMNLRNNHTRGR